MITHLLAAGFALPTPDGIVETAGRCALCGKDVRSGVELSRLLKATASDVADTFRFQDDNPLACAACAACYNQSRVLTGSIFATREVGLKPTVSARPGRPRWIDLLATVPHGTENVAIITDNTKRRLWPRATVSLFGAHWRPLFVVGDQCRLLTINIDALLDCLALITAAYSAGLSKTVIASNVLQSISKYDPAWLLALERKLRLWRGRDEFLIALYIAQEEDK